MKEDKAITLVQQLNSKILSPVMTFSFELEAWVSKYIALNEV